MSSAEAFSSSEARTPASKRRNNSGDQDPIAPDTNGKRPRSSETTTRSWHLRGTHSWHVSRSLAAALQGRNKEEEEEWNRFETVRLCSDVFFLEPYLKLNTECPPELRRIPFQIIAESGKLREGDFHLKLKCGWGSNEVDSRTEEEKAETGEWMEQRHKFRVLEAEVEKEEYNSGRESGWMGSSVDKWNFGAGRMRLLSGEHRCRLLSGGSKSFEVQVAVSAEVTVVEWSASGAVGALSDLLESGDHSDVTLVARGGQSFPVHRALLCSRSPVLAAMFSHRELLESRKGEVRMDDMGPEVVEGMLRFLYTDSVTDTEKDSSQANYPHFLELLRVAEKYEIQDLKDAVEKHLMNHYMNRNIAGYILLAADLYRAPRLLEASLDCIANKIYKVMNNPYFKDILAKTELARDLFRAVAKKMEKADLEHDSTLVQGPEEMFYYTIE